MRSFILRTNRKDESVSLVRRNRENWKDKAVATYENLESAKKAIEFYTRDCSTDFEKARELYYLFK
jgi:hypothetical protein